MSDETYATFSTVVRIETYGVCKPIVYNRQEYERLLKNSYRWRNTPRVLKHSKQNERERRTFLYDDSGTQNK